MANRITFFTAVVVPILSVLPFMALAALPQQGRGEDYIVQRKITFPS
jgi:hypothetical protein